VTSGDGSQHRRQISGMRAPGERTTKPALSFVFALTRTTDSLPAVSAVVVSLLIERIHQHHLGENMSILLLTST